MKGCWNIKQGGMVFPHWDFWTKTFEIDEEESHMENYRWIFQAEERVL